MIVAGDIGGTNVRLALYELRSGITIEQDTKHYRSKDFPNLESALRQFLGKNTDGIKAICLGVPGPVVNGEVRLTNLPWSFSEASLKSVLQIDRIRIVNDLYAVAASLPYLEAEDLILLHPGSAHTEPRSGDRYTVVAPGTGLGHAFTAKIHGMWEIFASEAGHMDFAPRDDLSLDLLRYLRGKFNGRVSYERVLCGPGLVNIYEFLFESGRYDEVRLSGEHLPQQIAEHALRGDSQCAVQTLDTFVRVLGGFAGNCALYNLSTGGIYLGGGIPPKILPKLQDGVLVEEYLRQGRMSAITEGTPLQVIVNDKAGILGAAHLAAACL